MASLWGIFRILHFKYVKFRICRYNVRRLIYHVVEIRVPKGCKLSCLCGEYLSEIRRMPVATVILVVVRVGCTFQCTPRGTCSILHNM
jgi:hypothetical protein